MVACYIMMIRKLQQRQREARRQADDLTLDRETRAALRGQADAFECTILELHNTFNAHRVYDPSLYDTHPPARSSDDLFRDLVERLTRERMNAHATKY